MTVAFFGGETNKLTRSLAFSVCRAQAIHKVRLVWLKLYNVELVFTKIYSYTVILVSLVF